MRVALVGHLGWAILVGRGARCTLSELQSSLTQPTEPHNPSAYQRDELCRANHHHQQECPPHRQRRGGNSTSTRSPHLHRQRRPDQLGAPRSTSPAHTPSTHRAQINSQAHQVYTGRIPTRLPSSCCSTLTASRAHPPTLPRPSPHPPSPLKPTLLPPQPTLELSSPDSSPLCQRLTAHRPLPRRLTRLLALRPGSTSTSHYRPRPEGTTSAAAARHESRPSEKGSRSSSASLAEARWVRSGCGGRRAAGGKAERMRRERESCRSRGEPGRRGWQRRSGRRC